MYKLWVPLRRAKPQTTGKQTKHIPPLYTVWPTSANSIVSNTQPQRGEGTVVVGGRVTVHRLG